MTTYKSERELINAINVSDDIQLIDDYIELVEWYYANFFIKGDDFEDVYEHYYDVWTKLLDIRAQLKPENKELIINQIRKIINEKSE